MTHQSWVLTNCYIMSNIGIVLKNAFPPDIRVEKEARALIRAGHKLFILAWNINNQKKPEEKIEGITVRRIIQNEFLAEKLNYVRFLLTLRDKFWVEQLEKFITNFNIDILHVVDFPLIRTCLIAAKTRQIPVVADLFEANYPVALATRFQRPIKERIFLSPQRWKKQGVKCLSDVDKILVVVEEAKEMLEAWGINGSKIQVVSNTVDIDHFQNIQFETEILNKYRDCFVVSYVGSFGFHRGLDTAIKSIKYLESRIKNIKLLLIGCSHDERVNRELKNLSKSLMSEDSVEFCGWQEFNKIPAFIKTSQICLVPHKYTGHTDTTVPHKLFQYMLMEKPVLVSSCKPLARIVKETKSGLVFRAGDAQDLADKIMNIYEDSKHYGENGRRAVYEKYNWENDARELLSVYQKLLA